MATAVPVANAVIDVWRTDIAGDYHTKTDKKGEWVFAGLPYVGYLCGVCKRAWRQPDGQDGVRAGREIPVDMVLSSGDGKKLTHDEALAANRRCRRRGQDSTPSGSGDSAAEKAKAAEIAKEIRSKISRCQQCRSRALIRSSATLSKPVTRP